MLRAFSTAATGMTANQKTVDVIANNLANINTNGFKKSQVDFQDLIYLKLAAAGREVAGGLQAPTGFEIGNGVRPAATTRVFTQGEAEPTGRDLDIAIEGDGFFQVLMPDGSIRYTRDGALKTNANGQLVTSSGYLLEPAITLPSGTRSVSVGADGTVSALVGNQTTPQTVGQITLVQFANPAGLTGEGQNLYSETGASGPAINGTAGTDGFGTIQQGFLEKSNVQMVTELVNLITAQRAYEVNSRAIKAGDEMLNTANRLING